MSELPASDEVALLWKLRESEHIFVDLQNVTGSELQRQQKLRAEYPADVVRAAFALYELRQRAKSKFSLAEKMWFDRKGLEQSTAEEVARHKAKRFEGHVWDFCCGIGSDTIALANTCEVSAVDLNPAACQRTEWNSELYEVSQKVQTVCSDVETITDRQGLLHLDPDRRIGSSGRAVRVEDYVPDLELMQKFADEFRGGAIKLSPASNFGGKFHNVEIELVSLRGECKEATIWFGEMCGEQPYRATVLPAGETIAGHPLDVMAEISSLGKFFYDPDPAVVRAGLVDLLADRLELQRLDDAEEFLTSDTQVDSPFVSTFEVLAELPNNDRKIRQYFRDGNFGQVEIKCRHIPIQAETIRRKLSLEGNEPVVLVYARIMGKTRAVVCRRIHH